jgi:hypothetical protein
MRLTKWETAYVVATLVIAFGIMGAILSFWHLEFSNPQPPQMSIGGNK